MLIDPLMMQLGSAGDFVFIRVGGQLRMSEGLSTMTVAPVLERLTCEPVQ